jgi:hypothetical protein
MNKRILLGAAATIEHQTRQLEIYAAKQEVLTLVSRLLDARGHYGPMTADGGGIESSLVDRLRDAAAELDKPPTPPPPPKVDLSTYTCHKQVQAAKIVDFFPAERGKIGMTVEDVALGKVAVFVTDTWADKHNPSIGGWLVRYTDGYESYSPPEAFESGYRLNPPPPPQAEQQAAKEPANKPEEIW